MEGSVSETPAKRWFYIIGSLLILVWTLFPVLWIVSLSFKQPGEVGNDPQFLPRDWTWENYRTVFNTDLFTSALVNSIGISLIATLVGVTFATLVSYAIARLDFPGKKAILSFALAIAMFPVVSLVGPLFNLWREVGLYDTWPGLIIPYISFALPLAIWTLSAFFREIPWEMEQAAQVDGATSWQAFRKVIVPLAAPGVFTAAILTFFFCWNDFVFGISLTSTDSARPVPAALAFFTGESQFEQPATAICAAAVVVTVPVIVIVLLFQRRIVAGLTSGAVKG
jgi:multiple sugar transport system permease protein